ncbi:MAG: DUF2442 domain-containing protein [Chitinivibrionales bacterium]|nr:DUF2442 domain-containing protein [Chitinivibrionales bacterium]
MFHITEVKALPKYRLWMMFSDGTSGEVDVSNLAGKGVFAKWTKPGEFEQVSIGSSGELLWGADVDLCPDTLYMRIAGKKPEDLFPMLKRENAHA